MGLLYTIARDTVATAAVTYFICPTVAIGVGGATCLLLVAASERLGLQLKMDAIMTSATLMTGWTWALLVGGVLCGLHYHWGPAEILQ